MSESMAISVAREIAASSDVVFAVLADPARHPEIDGSGMLRSATSSGTITDVGGTFTMGMHNDEMGDYEMINYVVEFQPGRRIAWEPALSQAGRAEDESDVGARSGHRWGFELVSLGPDRTRVTESYDCRTSPDWLQKAVKGGRRWEPAMERTLENLDRVCQDRSS